MESVSEDDSLTNLLTADKNHQLPPVTIDQKVTHSGSITHIDQHVEITPSKRRKSKDKNIKQDEERIVVNNDDVIKYIDKEIQNAAIPDEERNICGCSTTVLKIFIGIIIVIFISISWTCATQFGKSTYSVHFKAPYFTTWFTTCFMVAIYPIFMIPLMCKKTPWRLRTFLQESAIILGPRGLCLQSLTCFLFRVILPFCFTWLLTNYLYFRSLEKLLPGTVTAVFSSSSCFVYILSLLFLKDAFYFVRLFSVLLSIGGIVLIGYDEGFGNSNTIGIIFVVLAALGSAVYQVMFKRIIGNATGNQVAFFLTLLGIVNIVIFWPVLFILDFYNYETLDWNMLPWKFLIGTGVMGAIFNYLVNFGISITYPLFISVGVLLGVPLSSIVDAIVRNSSFDWIKIIAVAMVLFAFILMLIPNEKLNKYDHACVKKKKNGENV